MTVRQHLRFSAVDRDSVNVLLQGYLDTAIEEEGNEQPFVAPETQGERDRVWTAWTEYVFILTFPGFPQLMCY